MIKYAAKIRKIVENCEKSKKKAPPAWATVWNCRNFASETYGFQWRKTLRLTSFAAAFPGSQTAWEVSLYPINNKKTTKQ